MNRIFTFLILLLFCTSARADELGNYPTLNLSKAAGVDASKNVGLTPITPSAICTLPNPASYALYFAAGAFNCSSGVQIGDQFINLLDLAHISFPDGGFYNKSAFSVGVPTTIATSSSGDYSAKVQPLVVSDTSTRAEPVSFFSPNAAASIMYLGVNLNQNYNSAALYFNLLASGSQTNYLCLSFYPFYNSCKLTYDGFGNVTALATMAVTNAGSLGSPNLILTACGSNCGLLSTGASKVGLDVGGAYVWDYGVTNASTVTFSVGTTPAMYTIATLPASPPALTRAGISNNNVACSYGATPVAGGTTKCTVEYTGAAWVIR